MDSNGSFTVVTADGERDTYSDTYDFFTEGNGVLRVWQRATQALSARNEKYYAANWWREVVL